MKIIVKPRGAGKTHKLIKMCAKDLYSLIVCVDKRAVDATFSQAKEMGVTIPMPLTFEEFRNRNYYGVSVNNFYFDNLDLLIQSLTSIPVAAVTLTKEEDE
jgi:hypothetical protein